jgi:hypothetical protein
MNALLHKDSTKGHFVPCSYQKNVYWRQTKGDPLLSRFNFFPFFFLFSFVATYRHSCPHLRTVGPFARNIQAYLTFNKMIHFSEQNSLAGSVHMPRTWCWVALQLSPGKSTRKTVLELAVCRRFSQKILQLNLHVVYSIDWILLCGMNMKKPYCPVCGFQMLYISTCME